MHGIGIGGGMHCNSFDAHLMGCAVNPQRNFTAVGNKYASDWHVCCSPLANHNERLVKFNRLRVLDQDRLDGT